MSRYLNTFTEHADCSRHQTKLNSESMRASKDIGVGEGTGVGRVRKAEMTWDRSDECHAGEAGIQAKRSGKGLQLFTGENRSISGSPVSQPDMGRQSV